MQHRSSLKKRDHASVLTIGENDHCDYVITPSQQALQLIYNLRQEFESNRDIRSKLADIGVIINPRKPMKLLRVN